MSRRSWLAVVIVLSASFAQAEDWPGWRGPRGDGHSAETNAPIKWSAKSLVWKTKLPGAGQSSPVVWGDRIFLTTALSAGGSRVVMGLDRKTGDILWQQTAWTGSPEASHKMNGWASASCATDGEQVVAFFGTGGLHCYSLEGTHRWSRDLGTFPGAWGTSACPIIAGDLIVQNCDSTKGSRIMAFDKKSGHTVWETPRDDPEKGGWSTPVYIKTAKGHEIVLNGETAVVAYDPITGKKLWSCKAFAGRGEPTVTPGDDRVFVINGLAGDIYSIRLGGTGDVTKSHMAWHTPRKGGRDQPSPILIGTQLLVANMKGVLTSYDSVSGKQVWQDRLRGEFTASPIAIDGKAYFINEAGETFVVSPGPKMNVVAENSLSPGGGEIFRASLTPSQGRILARSTNMLYCVGK